jgi:hypothetical protein
MGALSQMAPPPLKPVNQSETEANLLDEEKKEPNFAERALADRAAASKQLENQINVLRAGLERRMTPAFDPALMKLAAGFLKPTRTGSFGESAGYAAENFSDENEKQVLRNQAVDKMQMELLEKQRALSQANLLDEFRMRQMGGMTSGEPQAAQRPPIGAPAGEAPSPQGAPQAAPQGAPEKRPEPAFSGRPITQRDIDLADLIDPTGNESKRLIERAKLGFEAQKVGYQGEEVDIKRKQLEQGERRKITPYMLPKEVEFTREEFEAYKRKLAEYRKSGDQNVLFNFYDEMGLLPPESIPKRTPTGAPGAPGAANAPNVQFSMPKTAEEKEIEKAASQKRNEELIKSDAEQRGRLTAGRDTAQERLIAANSIYGIAENAETGKVFDLFSKPTIRNAIIEATSGPNGVRLPLGSVQIASLKPALLRASGNPKLVDAAMMVLSNSTMLNLQNTISLMSKQGAITEGERALIANLAPNVWEDSRKSAMAKSQLIKARAEFDQDVAEDYNAWAKKNPTKYIDDFKESKEYKDSYNHYNKVTKDLAQKYFPGFKGAPETSRRAVNAGSLESQIR